MQRHNLFLFTPRRRIGTLACGREGLSHAHLSPVQGIASMHGRVDARSIHGLRRLPLPADASPLVHLQDVTREDFQLPTLGPKLAGFRDEVCSKTGNHLHS